MERLQNTKDEEKAGQVYNSTNVLILEGVTMTLDWVFADAKRVAFGYTISGLLEERPSATKVLQEIPPEIWLRMGVIIAG